MVELSETMRMWAAASPAALAVRSSARARVTCPEAHTGPTRSAAQSITPPLIPVVMADPPWLSRAHSGPSYCETAWCAIPCGPRPEAGDRDVRGVARPALTIGRAGQLQPPAAQALHLVLAGPRPATATKHPDCNLR